MPIASPSPIRPSRTAPASRGTSAFAAGRRRRRDRDRAQVQPEPFLHRAGELAVLGRNVPIFDPDETVGEGAVDQPGDTEPGDPEAGRDLDLAQLAIEEEPRDLGRKVGRRGGCGRHASMVGRAHLRCNRSSVHSWRPSGRRGSGRREPSALLEHELQVLRDPGREARLAQGEVVLPHPDEPVVEAHRADDTRPGP